MRRLLLTVLIVAGLTAPAHSQIKGIDAFGYVSGETFLAFNEARKADYAAGLADQLVGLFQAQLTDGFRWFEACARNTSPAGMADMLTAFLNANPARLAEPAANNFIWATAKGCAGK